MTITYKDWLAQNGADDNAESLMAWRSAVTPFIPASSCDQYNYAGGTVLGGNWGAPSRRDLEPLEHNQADENPQVPHPDIEWQERRYRNGFYYPIFDNLVTIEPNPQSGEYAFFVEEEGGHYFHEHCTPETIDEIIAKLQHFKQVVFGEDTDK